MGHCGSGRRLVTNEIAKSKTHDCAEKELTTGAQKSRCISFEEASSRPLTRGMCILKEPDENRGSVSPQGRVASACWMTHDSESSLHDDERTRGMRRTRTMPAEI
jgi:hypothetical protein